MSVVKISGLDTTLMGSLIRNAMGFNVINRTGWIGIFQGVIPSRDQAVANVDTFRNSDLLWSSTMPNESTVPMSYSVGESDFIMPIKSGTASWFLYAGIEDDTHDAHAVLMGNVSVLNGGGDLLLSSVNFVLGNKYRMHYLQIAFPYSFSY